MTWSARTFTVLVALAWSGVAVAETPLSYTDALQGALDHNPGLRRAKLDQQSAEAGVLSSQGQFDPTLGIDGSWRSSQSRGFFQGFPFTSKSRSWDLGTNVGGQVGSGTSYNLNLGLDRNFSSFVTNFGPVSSDEQIQDTYTSDMNVSLTQQLLKGLKMSFNLQNVTRARHALSAAELSAERARQEALSQTAQAYWTWAYQEELESIATESVNIAEEALRVGTLKVEAGDSPRVEQMRLEAALVQAQAAAMDSEVSASQARDNLLLLIGRQPGENVLAATEPGDVQPFELDGEAATVVALAQNLDLAIARSEAETADFDLMNAKHGRLPTLSATGAAGIGAQDSTAGAALSGIADEDAFPFVAVSGNFSVPLGNRAARGEVARTTVAAMQRDNAVAELEDTVRSQVAQQVRVLEASRRRVELADANVRLAVETLSVEEALYEAGDTLQKDVLEARSEVDRVKAEAAKARTDYRLAQVELLRLQGQLSEQL